MNNTNGEATMNRYDIAALLASVAAISSLAGLANYLRSDRPLTLRHVLSAMLYSGVLGFGVAACWMHFFGGNNVLFMIGVSGLAGLGGANLLDFVFLALHKGLRIEVKLSEFKSPSEKAKEE